MGWKKKPLAIEKRKENVPVNGIFNSEENRKKEKDKVIFKYKLVSYKLYRSISRILIVSAPTTSTTSASFSAGSLKYSTSTYYISLIYLKVSARKSMKKY